jgi:VWFA-related protein
VCALLPGAAPAQQAPLAQPVQQAPAANGAQPAYTLQVNAQQVVLDVIVLDRQNKPVTGLMPNDFSITENKVPQRIDGFTAWAPPAPQQVIPIHSTAQLDHTEPDAPVNILVIDEVSTRFEDLAFARYSLKRYLNTQGDTLLEPTMLVAANYHNVAMLQDYTTSRKAILEALEHHIANYSELARGQNGSWLSESIGSALDSIEAVAQAAAGHPGHKNVIWIGRGFPPIDYTALVPEAREQLQAEIERCITLLKNARVTLTTIDPAGLRASGPTYGIEGELIDSPFGGQVDFEAIAQATGGAAIDNRNDVDRMIDNSVRNGENFYSLAYRPTGVPPNPKPGDYRNVRVVMRDPSLHAITRAGYYADPPPLSPVNAASGKYSQDFLIDIGEASRNLLQYDGVPFRMVCAPDAPQPDAPQPGTQTHCTIRMTTENLAEAPHPANVDAATQVAQLTVLGESFDSRGHLLHQSGQVATVRMVPGKALSLDIPIQLEADAKAARLRFIVRDNTSGKLGAQNVYLIDPKLLRDPANGENYRLGK